MTGLQSQLTSELSRYLLEKKQRLKKFVKWQYFFFKYVLIEAYATDSDQPDKEHSKLLVRGNLSAEYHADVYDVEEESLRAKGLDCQCLGGGRILHEKSQKFIKVYGYSVGVFN